MATQTETTSEQQEPLAPITIKVIGVGDAGGNVVAHLAREPLAGVSFAGVNTNVRALAHSALATQLSLGASLMRGLGTGGDPERGRAAAEGDVAGLREICAGADILFLVTGLGGGTGTGASPVVARIAREMGALVLAIVILPFECEGLRRQRQAQAGLHELKKAADGVICVPNQKVFNLIDEHTSLVEAFHLTNELVAQGIRSIWRLISQPGLIQVDFADLCAVTRGKHAESVLATAEARGENRVREVLEKIQAHPLLESGQELTEAAGVLVSILGGPELAMAEVNRLMEQINRQAEQAQIIMGAAVDASMGDRLQLTVVASRQGPADADSRDPDEADQASSLAGEFDSPRTASSGSHRPTSRFVAPPPELTPEQAERLWSQQQGRGRRRRGRANSKMRQGQLPLEIVSKGRFEQSEPTIHRGEDLDVPTYIRRGVALN